MDYFIIVFNVLAAALLITACILAVIDVVKGKRPPQTVHINEEFTAFGTLTLYVIYFSAGMQFGSTAVPMIVNLLNK